MKVEALVLLVLRRPASRKADADDSCGKWKLEKGKRYRSFHLFVGIKIFGNKKDTWIAKGFDTSDCYYKAHFRTIIAVAHSFLLLWK